MNRQHTLAAILAAAILFLASLLNAAEEVRVSAPASMIDALNEVAARFDATGKHAQVVINYGSSGTLAKQIAEGAPADLFISANSKWMKYLRDEKKIDPASERTLAANTLVFVGPRNPAITALADVAKLKLIAIGSPKSVPAGEYAAQALEKAGLYTQLEREQKLVMAKDVRQALTYADRGETDGAFVYKTDAPMATQAVILFEVPPDAHDTVTYPIALTTDGAKNAEAKAFYEFLTGPDALKVFVGYGFSAPH